MRERRARGTKARGSSRALVLAALIMGGDAKADTLSAAAGMAGFAPNDPPEWVENCPRDLLSPGEMGCLSRGLVPRSLAEARKRARRARRPFTASPDAGEGVDAGAEIGACDGAGAGGSGSAPNGWAPADLAKAYAIPATPKGAGKVVAIVDACAETTIVADLAAYRAQYGLPALPQCGGANGVAPVPGAAAPCFGVVSQRGGSDLPPSDGRWAPEIALDVDMVSAACPDCSILLVEADTPNTWDLGPAVNEAVSLGAAAVSNSYGTSEDPNDQFGAAYSDGPYATYYEHDGVLIAVASGDYLYDNQSSGTAPAPSFPATIPTVLGVGGTNLIQGTGTARGGFSESVWTDGAYGTTSGCSLEFGKPAYQAGIAMGSCTMRGSVDVSAVGSDVATYLGGRWMPESGTSCASPFVAGLFARLGIANRPNGFVYSHGSSFYDVTSGNNDPSGKCTDVMCTAGVGWDGPSGWGTPNAAALLADVDGGAVLDAGGRADAGAGVDGGSARADDAGGGNDATVSDAGNGVDASLGPDDSGGPSDDAASGGDGGGNGAGGSPRGCGCRAVGTAPLPGAPTAFALLAFGAVVLVGRKRR